EPVRVSHARLATRPLRVPVALGHDRPRSAGAVRRVRRRLTVGASTAVSSSLRPAGADLATSAGTAPPADPPAGFMAVEVGWVDHVQMTTGLPSPGRVRLARTLAWPALLLPAITLVLHLANADTPVHTWWGGSVVLAAGLGAMGSLLAIRLPENPIGW